MKYLLAISMLYYCLPFNQSNNHFTFGDAALGTKSKELTHPERQKTFLRSDQKCAPLNLIHDHSNNLNTNTKLGQNHDTLRSGNFPEPPPLEEQFYYRSSSIKVVNNNHIEPVKLKHFIAVPLQNSLVKLEWTTLSETDNQHFYIERSSSTEDWKVISAVNGAGTSQQSNHYVVYDRNPDIGTNYYCLKQVNSKGKYTYSPVRVVNTGPFAQTQVAIYSDNVSTASKTYKDDLKRNIATIKVYDITPNERVADSDIPPGRDSSSILNINLRNIPVQELKIEAGKSSGVVSKQQD